MSVSKSVNYLSYYGYNQKILTNYITLYGMLSLFGPPCTAHSLTGSAFSHTV